MDDFLGGDGLRSFERVYQGPTTYYTALVRFSKDGRTYPVNCWPHFAIGGAVLVRMDGLEGQIKTATIVEHTRSSRPCRNGVVGRVADRDWYGGGPGEVRNAADLEAFPHKHNWMKFKTGVSERTRAGAERYRHLKRMVEFAEEWPATYIKKDRRSYWNISPRDAQFF